MNHIIIPSDLIEQVAEGNEKAFEQLYQLTYIPVYAFLLSMTRNQNDTDDLLQETYLRVFGSAHLYRKGNPMAWIMKIAKNLFLMDKRKKRPEPISDPENRRDLRISLDCIEDVETRILLEQLLEELNQEEREIIVLHVIGGFRHRELAEMMDMPLGTVLYKYNRAIKKLKKNASEATEGGSYD